MKKNPRQAVYQIVKQHLGSRLSELENLAVLLEGSENSQEREAILREIEAGIASGSIAAGKARSGTKERRQAAAKILQDCLDSAVYKPSRRRSLLLRIRELKQRDSQLQALQGLEKILSDRGVTQDIPLLQVYQVKRNLELLLAALGIRLEHSSADLLKELYPFPDSQLLELQVKDKGGKSEQKKKSA